MMNKEQREYTIEQIKKNNIASEKLEKEVNNYAFLTGFGVIGSVIFFIASTPIFGLKGYSSWQSVITSTIAVSSMITISILEKMVYKLAKKAGLEVMTEQLEYALNMDDLDSENKIENEEIKGRTR